jgi:hypothetical protein
VDPIDSYQTGTKCPTLHATKTKHIPLVSVMHATSWWCLPGPFSSLPVGGRQRERPGRCLSLPVQVDLRESGIALLRLELEQLAQEKGRRVAALQELLGQLQASCRELGEEFQAAVADAWPRTHVNRFLAASQSDGQMLTRRGIPVVHTPSIHMSV